MGFGSSVQTNKISFWAENKSGYKKETARYKLVSMEFLLDLLLTIVLSQDYMAHKCQIAARDKLHRFLRHGDRSNKWNAI